MSKHKAIVILIPYKINGNEPMVWLQTRNSSDELNGLLEFPGGKVEPGESLVDAVVRETQEETQRVLDPNSLVHFGDYEFSPLVISVFLFNDEESLFNSEQFKALTLLEQNSALMPPNNQNIIKDLLKRFR